jgi:hypothetical protein
MIEEREETQAQKRKKKGGQEKVKVVIENK